jgi:hypothetical protein
MESFPAVPGGFLSLEWLPPTPTSKGGPAALNQQPRMSWSCVDENTMRKHQTGFKT